MPTEAEVRQQLIGLYEKEGTEYTDNDLDTALGHYFKKSPSRAGRSRSATRPSARAMRTASQAGYDGGKSAYERIGSDAAPGFTDQLMFNMRNHIREFKSGSMGVLAYAAGALGLDEDSSMLDYSEELRRRGAEQMQDEIRNDSRLQALMAWQEDEPVKFTGPDANWYKWSMLERGLASAMPSVIEMAVIALTTKGAGSLLSKALGGATKASAKGIELANAAKKLDNSLDLAEQGLKFTSKLRVERAAQVMGGLGMTGLEGSTQYNEAMRYLVDEKGYEVEEANEIAATSAAMYAPIAGVLEYLPFGRLMKKTGVMKLSKNFGTKTFAEAAEEVIKKTKQQGVGGNGRMSLKIFKEALSQGVFEATTEYSQYMTQVAVQTSYEEGWGDTPEMSLENITNAWREKWDSPEARESVYGGFLMGKTMGGLSAPFDKPGILEQAAELDALEQLIDKKNAEETPSVTIDVADKKVTIAKMKEIALDNEIEIPKNIKKRADIAKFINDALNVTGRPKESKRGTKEAEDFELGAITEEEEVDSFLEATSEEASAQEAPPVEAPPIDAGTSQEEVDKAMSESFGLGTEQTEEQTEAPDLTPIVDSISSRIKVEREKDNVSPAQLKRLDEIETNLSKIESREEVDAVNSQLNAYKKDDLGEDSVILAPDTKLTMKKIREHAIENGVPETDLPTGRIKKSQLITFVNDAITDISTGEVKEETKLSDDEQAIEYGWKSAEDLYKNSENMKDKDFEGLNAEEKANVIRIRANYEKSISKPEPKKIKKTEEFRVKTGEGIATKSGEAIKLDNAEGDFYIAKEDNGWIITDKITGLTGGGYHKTRQGAIDNFNDIMNDPEKVEKMENARENNALPEVGQEETETEEGSPKLDIEAQFQKTGSVGTLLTEDPETAHEIVSKLEKDYPEITRKVSEKVFDTHGEEVMGKAIGAAAEWSSTKGKLDTPPHEHAHPYIDMLEGTKVVQMALKAFAVEGETLLQTKERLVDYLGKDYVNKIKDKKLKTKVARFIKKFWLEVKNYFGKLSTDKEAVELLSERFFRGEKKGKAKPTTRGFNEDSLQKYNSVSSRLRSEVVKTTLKTFNLIKDNETLVINEQFYKRLEKAGIKKAEIEFIKHIVKNDDIGRIKGDEFKFQAMKYLFPITIKLSTELIQDRSKKPIKDDALPFDEYPKIESPTNYYGIGGEQTYHIAGGVNYREYIIEIPIELHMSHPKFATKNMLGWFRSDTEIEGETEGQEMPNKFSPSEDEYGGQFEPGVYYVEDGQWYLDGSKITREQAQKAWNRDNHLTGKAGSTFRLIEFQSDLFQKRRKKRDYTRNKGVAKVTDDKAREILGKEGQGELEDAEGYVFDMIEYSLIENGEDAGKYLYYSGSESEIVSAQSLLKTLSMAPKSNLTQQQKNENLFVDSLADVWEEYFTKAIIQFAAEEGFKRIKFPTGETAAIIERHPSFAKMKKANEEELNASKLKQENADSIVEDIVYRAEKLKELAYENENKVRMLKNKIANILKLNKFKYQEPSYKVKGYEWGRIQHTESPIRKGDHVDKLPAGYKGYYAYGYNTRNGLTAVDSIHGESQKPRSVAIPISKKKALEVWEKNKDQHLDQGDRTRINDINAEIQSLSHSEEIKNLWALARIYRRDIGRKVSRLNKKYMELQRPMGEIKGMEIQNFYQNKVRKILQKLRKKNLELAQDSLGNYWFETKLTEEDGQPITQFQRKDKLPELEIQYQEEGASQQDLVADNLELATKITERLAKQFPNIKVERVIGLIKEHGVEAVGSAFKDTVKVSDLARIDTMPHEYAHIYIDLMQDTYAVKLGLKRLMKGGFSVLEAKEKLAQQIGEYYANEMKGIERKRFKVWLKQFWKAVKGFFGDASAMGDFIAQQFFDSSLDNIEILDNEVYFAEANAEKEATEKDEDSGSEEIKTNEEFVTQLSKYFGVAITPKEYSDLIEATKVQDSNTAYIKWFRDWANKNLFLRMDENQIDKLDDDFPKWYTNELTQFYQTKRSTIKRFVPGMTGESRAYLQYVMKKVKGKIKKLTLRFQPESSDIPGRLWDVLGRKLLSIDVNDTFYERRIKGTGERLYILSSKEIMEEIVYGKDLDESFFKQKMGGMTVDLISQIDSTLAASYGKDTRPEKKLVVVVGTRGGDNRMLLMASVSKEVAGIMSEEDLTQYFNDELEAGNFGDKDSQFAKDAVNAFINSTRGTALADNPYRFAQAAGRHEFMKSVYHNKYHAEEYWNGLEALFDRIKIPLFEGHTLQGFGEALEKAKVTNSIMQIPNDTLVAVKGKDKMTMWKDFNDGGIFTGTRWMKVFAKIAGREVGKENGTEVGFIKSIFNDRSDDGNDYIGTKDGQFSATEEMQFYKGDELFAEVRFDKNGDSYFYDVINGTKFDHIGTPDEIKLSAGKYKENYVANEMPSDSVRVLFTNDEISKNSAPNPVAGVEMALSPNSTPAMQRLIGEYTKHMAEIAKKYSGVLFSLRNGRTKDKDGKDVMNIVEVVKSMSNNNDVPTEIETILQKDPSGKSLLLPSVLMELTKWMNNSMIDGPYKGRDKGTGTSAYYKPHLDDSIKQGELKFGAGNQTMMRLVSDKMFADDELGKKVWKKLDREAQVNALNYWLEDNNFYVLASRQPVNRFNSVTPMKLIGFKGGLETNEVFHNFKDVKELLEGDWDGDKGYYEAFQDDEFRRAYTDAVNSKEWSDRDKKPLLRIFNEKLTSGDRNMYGSLSDFYKVIENQMNSEGAVGLVVTASSVFKNMASKLVRMKVLNQNGKAPRIFSVANPTDRMVFPVELNSETLLSDKEIWDNVNQKGDFVSDEKGKKLSKREIAEKIKKGEPVYLDTTIEHAFTILMQAATDDAKYGLLAKMEFSLDFLVDIMFVDGVDKHYLRPIKLAYSFFNQLNKRQGRSFGRNLEFNENIEMSRMMFDLYNKFEDGKVVELSDKEFFTGLNAHLRIFSEKSANGDDWKMRGILDALSKINISANNSPSPVDTLLSIVGGESYKRDHQMQENGIDTENINVLDPTRYDKKIEDYSHYKALVGDGVDENTSLIFAVEELIKKHYIKFRSKKTDKEKQFDRMVGMKLATDINDDFTNVLEKYLDKETKELKEGFQIDKNVEFQKVVDDYTMKWKSLTKAQQMIATFYFLTGTTTSEDRTVNNRNIVKLLPSTFLDSDVLSMYSERKLAINDKFLEPGGLDISEVEMPDASSMGKIYRKTKGWSFSGVEALMLNTKKQDEINEYIDNKLEKVCQS